MRNLSKQNRKKIFDLIKRDCTFVGAYDLEHSEETVLTYLLKPGTQIHRDVEEVRVVKIVRPETGSNPLLIFGGSTV